MVASSSDARLDALDHQPPADGAGGHPFGRRRRRRSGCRPTASSRAIRLGVPMASTVPLALSSCTSPLHLASPSRRRPATARSPTCRTAPARCSPPTCAAAWSVARRCGPRRGRRSRWTSITMASSCAFASPPAPRTRLTAVTHDLVARRAVDDDGAGQVEDVERPVRADLERAGRPSRCSRARCARPGTSQTTRRVRARARPPPAAPAASPSCAGATGSAIRTSTGERGERSSALRRMRTVGGESSQARVSVTTCSCHRQSGPLRPGCPSGLR